MKYAIIFSLLPSVAFAQLVKKDETAGRNYFDEDGTMRIPIAISFNVIRRAAEVVGRQAVDRWKLDKQSWKTPQRDLAS